MPPGDIPEVFFFQPAGGTAVLPFGTCFLFILPETDVKFCVFCTGKQMSVSNFTQFCILTKINIAFGAAFVYNVTIRVSAPTWKDSPSRKE